MEAKAVTADILSFRPVNRQGDPDFPGIAELAAFQTRPAAPAQFDDLAMDCADPGYLAPDQDSA
jgi:hypothetical protein